MSIENLTESQRAASRVLGAVTSDHLAGATPCTDWDVAALIDNLVGSQSWFLHAVSIVAPIENGWGEAFSKLDAHPAG